MNKEIKQRIEQLNNGKIPKGYKKTDFGVFPSDWVTDKKLIDIGTFGKGKGIPGNKMQSGGVPCVGYGDIYMKYNHFHFEEAQSFVDEETAKDSQLIKKGTLLFTGTGETAEEIGKCVCYNGDSTICAGGDIITFVPQDVNPLFLAYQQYQNFSLKKKASFGQGHSVVHIQKESLEKLNVAYPESKNEQSRIVEILMKWDKAIELYDKQIDALTRYKAVCLRKMFPAKGQNVPEWRFQGFTGAWEQRKLGDIANIIDPHPSHRAPAAVNEGIPFIGIGDVDALGNIDKESARTVEEAIYDEHHRRYNLDIPSLGIGRVASLGKVIRLRNDIGKYAVSPTMSIIQFQDTVDIDYMYSCMESPIFQKQFASQSSGSTRQSVGIQDLRELQVSIPKNEYEQKQIGRYFKEVDNLITLHQRKKETIINQRKTLQQYLLNGIVRV